MSAREKGIPTKDSVSLLPCFYFVELPILVSSVVSLYFLEWTDVFKPVKSGFNCHDRSLSLPYIDPNHEVIPLLMLLSLAFAGPAITPINHRLPNRGSELRKLNRHELRWKRQSAAHIHESDSQPPSPCRCHCRH